MNEQRAAADEVLLEQGLQRQLAGDFAAARRSYAAVLAGDPEHADALRLLGVLSHLEGAAEESVRLLERARIARPGQPALLRELGIVLLAAGRAAEAAAPLREALDLEPGDAETIFSLGAAERRAGRAETALPLLRAAALSLPDQPRVLLEFALALEETGTAEEAEAACRQALALAPEDEEIRAVLERLAPGQAAAPAVRLYIGTPCFGGNVTDHYTLSLLGLQAACLRRGIPLAFCLLHGDALITRARNSVVAEFLRDPKATHLLFIDADIGFTPQEVFRLLEADRDLVGGAYPVKLINWDRAGRGIDPATTFDYVAELLEPTAPVPADGFAPARYVGTGFLMVRRSVFERMAARYPEIRYRRTHATADSDIAPDGLRAFFDCVIDPDSGHYLSEDFTFCKRWLDMGGELWVDTRSRLRHVGRHVFAGDYGQR